MLAQVTQWLEKQLEVQFGFGWWNFQDVYDGLAQFYTAMFTYPTLDDLHLPPLHRLEDLAFAAPFAMRNLLLCDLSPQAVSFLFAHLDHVVSMTLNLIPSIYTWSGANAMLESLPRLRSLHTIAIERFEFGTS
ncbi:Aste57867_9170 [Aphanomyces stellatus]|uniref:Aste57867_9170 protein n=1 Tax=Aphanomyces stellatus TaxID=120398 RepID=A0A485KMB6_9STRA|nr:hypothetical protein As57867_009134 [Aphanomyces stellatus]VFT86054.1 Aste57867_9170 [Aphanomyces stellatus]